jgi:hypothetical protein
MSNYHQLHCETCAAIAPDSMRTNRGAPDHERVLAHAAALVRIADWCQQHEIDVRFELLWVRDIDTGWLRRHLGHDVHVCCEYGCPCPCERKPCETCSVGGYDANGAPSWDGNGAPV